ncbi:MAG TPA: helix-turn-helix transcriptional regulator [Pseudomonadota bacterium]|nr:helix-turn-helix transcriptional regulator [Pseudomonadota bacterium]
MVRGRQNPLHLGFARRLARVRKNADISGSALSLASGLAHNTAGDLETGTRVPRLDTVEKLARALSVSPSFLAYGIDIPCEPPTQLLSAGLPERLSACRQMRKLSRRQVGALSGTSDNFVQMTETGRTVPSIAKVEQLAKALHVSVCWLAFGLGHPELPANRRRRSDAPPAPGPQP